MCLQPMPGRQKVPARSHCEYLCPLVVIHVDVDDVRDAIPLQLVKLQKLRIVAAL